MANAEKMSICKSVCRFNSITCDLNVSLDIVNLINTPNILHDGSKISVKSEKLGAKPSSKAMLTKANFAISLANVN